MTKEELIRLKKKLAKLTPEEKIERDKRLRQIATGEIIGEKTGYPSLDKPWLKHYPEESIGVEIPKVTAYQQIYDKMKDKSGMIALEYFKRKITYKEVFENIEKTAKALKAIGVKKGDVVTLAMPTCPETVYLFYALNRIGAISNCVDPRMTVDGFKMSLESTDSHHIITVDMCEPIISEVVKEADVKNVISVSPVESAPLPIKALAMSKKAGKSQFMNWQEFIKKGKAYQGTLDSEYEENMPLTIVHTGGTTGKPKGVVLTNENFNNMALTQVLCDLGFEAGDRFLTFLPPFTAYCLVNAIHDGLYLGWHNILIPMFQPSDFPYLMKKHKPNHVLSGPILWDAFIRSKKQEKENLRYLKSPISGGDSLNIELERQVNEFLKNHGSPSTIVQGYGMSEISAAAFYAKQSSYKPGSVGIPYIKNNVGIFDPDTGEELQYNQEGEICISSPTLMLGYYNNPEETARVIEVKDDGERWLHTGDIGRVDEDGNLYIIGRMKRMIVRNGNKLFPSNIETIVMRNPAVESVAIVQMPDDEERHVPIAHIVLKDECKGLEEEIVEQVEKTISDELPEHNIPYAYVFRDSLPVTGLNKVDFKTLEKESLEYCGIKEKIHHYTQEQPKQNVKKS